MPSRGVAPLVQAAPRRERGVRQAGGERLRRLLRHGSAVREKEKGGTRVFDSLEVAGWCCGGDLGPNPSYAASRPKSLRYCMGLL